jgi:exonuclease III
MMSFTLSVPFLEENVGIGRVAKSFTAENYTHRSDSTNRADYRPLRNRENRVYGERPPTEDLNTTSVTKLLPSTEVPCFNKFLLHHNLPILQHTQTLKSFIQYLVKLNHTKPIKISINYILLETHIYTNTSDPILTNHFLLNTADYHKYFTLPLRSTYQHFNQTNNSSIQNFTPLNLNIITHNVHGYNSITKRQLFEDFCYKNNYNIISLTETKLTDNRTFPKLLDSPTYNYFCSNLNNTISTHPSEGTALMVHKDIKPYIFNVKTHEGGAIALDFTFKNNHKFRIISVYLSSTNSERRNKTQSTVISWIQQAISIGLYSIILGDFNAETSYDAPHSSKTKLINFLISHNMFDIANYTDNTIQTWSSSRYSSRIDYIWASQQIIHYLNTFNILDSSTITESDHKILSSSWTFPFGLQKKTRFKSRTKRKIFNYKSMSKEQWENFANSVTSNIQNNNTLIHNNSNESLEKIWHKIQISIQAAASQHIPYRKYSIRNLHYLHS